MMSFEEETEGELGIRIVGNVVQLVKIRFFCCLYVCVGVYVCRSFWVKQACEVLYTQSYNIDWYL